MHVVYLHYIYTIVYYSNICNLTKSLLLLIINAIRNMRYRRIISLAWINSIYSNFLEPHEFKGKSRVQCKAFIYLLFIHLLNQITTLTVNLTIKG